MSDYRIEMITDETLKEKGYFYSEPNPIEEDGGYCKSFYDKEESKLYFLMFRKYNFKKYRSDLKISFDFVLHLKKDDFDFTITVSPRDDWTVDKCEEVCLSFYKDLKCSPIKGIDDE